MSRTIPDRCVLCRHPLEPERVHAFITEARMTRERSRPHGRRPGPSFLPRGVLRMLNGGHKSPRQGAAHSACWDKAKELFQADHQGTDLRDLIPPRVSLGPNIRVVPKAELVPLGAQGEV
jgi:hypothetical protein